MTDSGSRTVAATKLIASGMGTTFLAFATPYVGTLLWFLAAFLGLGAIVLGSFRRPQVTPTPV